MFQNLKKIFPGFLQGGENFFRFWGIFALEKKKFKIFQDGGRGRGPPPTGVLLAFPPFRGGGKKDFPFSLGWGVIGTWGGSMGGGGPLPLCWKENFFRGGPGRFFFIWPKKKTF